MNYTIHHLETGQVKSNMQANHNNKIHKMQSIPLQNHYIGVYIP